MGKVALCIKSDRLTELRGRKSNLDAFFCFENYYPGRGKLKRYISPLNNVVGCLYYASGASGTKHTRFRRCSTVQGSEMGRKQVHELRRWDWSLGSDTFNPNFTHLIIDYFKFMLNSLVKMLSKILQLQTTNMYKIKN